MGIVVALEFDMSYSLRFHIIFVILSGIILPSSRFALCEFTGENSKFIINKLTFHQLFNIEISNWIDKFFFLFGTGSGSPMGLNAGYVPLIHDSNCALAFFISIEGIEDIKILLIN